MLTSTLEDFYKYMTKCLMNKESEIILIESDGNHLLDYNKEFPGALLFFVNTDRETALKNIEEVLNLNFSSKDIKIITGLPEDDYELQSLKDTGLPYTMEEWKDVRKKLDGLNLNPFLVKPTSMDDIITALFENKILIFLAHSDRKTKTMFFPTKKEVIELTPGILNKIEKNKPISRVIILLSCETRARKNSTTADPQSNSTTADLQSDSTMADPQSNSTTTDPQSITEAFLKLGANLVIAPTGKIPDDEVTDFLEKFSSAASTFQ